MKRTITLDEETANTIASGLGDAARNSRGTFARECREAQGEFLRLWKAAIPSYSPGKSKAS